MSTFTFTNAWLCRMENCRLIPHLADLTIEEGRMVRVSTAGSKSVPRGCKKIDLQGRVVTAPLVNFHEHAYARLTKGLPNVKPCASFLEILENLWWRLDRALDADMIRAGAELTAMEAVTSGVTYIFDHHSSPSCVTGSLSIIADVFREHGLCSVLCYETSDRNGTTNVNEALCENESAGMLGLHAPFTLSDLTLAKISRQKTHTLQGIHTHLAEDAYENDYSQKHFGMSATQRLAQFGLLNDKSIVAHGVHLSPVDLALLAHVRTGLACCPESNMNNSVGVADFTSIPDGIPVLAGTDGMHAKIARTLKLLFLLYRHQGGTTARAFDWFTRVLADQLHFAKKYFPDYPVFNQGDRADLVVWDYVPPTPLNADNVIGHYIYGILESRPRSVMVDGRFLMRDFVLMISDEAQRRQHIAEQGQRLFQHFREGSA